MTTAQLQATPSDLLALYFAGNDVPKAESFTPTPENPVKEIKIGQIDGRDIFVYGVRTEFTGLTGQFLSRMTVYNWHWELDRDRALEEANVTLWGKTPEAEAWITETVTDANWDKIETRVVNPTVGASFTVYRVLVAAAISCYWTICREAEVCEKEHVALHLAIEHKKPAAPVGEIDWESFVVPPIKTQPFATCDHCKEVLFHHLTIMEERTRIFYRWFMDRTQAETAHAAITQIVNYYGGRDRDERIKKEHRSLSGPIHAAATELKVSKNLRFFWSLFPDLFADLEEADHYVEHTDPNFIEHYDRLEKAAKALDEALKGEADRRFEQILENDLNGKLSQVLGACMPSCPFCGKEYKRGDEWLVEILTYGEGYLICECPKDGWDAYNKEQAATLPVVIPEMKELLPGGNHPLKIATRLLNNTTVVEIMRIVSAGKMLVRFVTPSDYHHRPMVQVDREAFLTSDMAQAKRVEVWPTSKTQLERERVERLERQCQDPDGRTYKIPLEWNAEKENWSQVWRGGGMMIIYAVDKHRTNRVQEPGWWYCQLIDEPDKAKRPGFALRIVNPVTRVPSDKVPR